MKHFNLLNNTRWFATVILLLTFCIGQTWGTSYTITFATGSSDGTSISSGSTNASTIVASGSTSYVTGKVTSTYSYYAGGSGLKVGKSGSAGSVSFSIATSYQLTNPTIIVKAKRYNSSKEVKLNANSVGQITTAGDANWHWYSYKCSGKITSLTLNASQYCWVESVTITDACNNIDVTGGSAVILPLGSTTYNAYDWSKAGAPWAQATVASYPISSSYYCVSFTQVKDAGSTNGLEFLASSGVVSISGITSTYGIDVDVNISSGSGFSIALTGATTLTGQSSGTKTISTTSTSATLTISKTAAGTGYVKYIKVTPKTAACGTDPTVGAASLNGSFSLSSVGVRCPTSGTAVQSNCSWEDYGFVWGTSNSGTRPDLTSDASNKVQTGTSGTGNTWDDALEGSFSTGVTYYYRAYGQNGHGLAYGTVASFTPFKVYYNANGGTGTIDDQIVNTGGSVTLSDGTGFSKTGYHITKWALGSAGGTQSNPSSSSGSVTANKEYYAIWTANTYAITLNQNGATTNSSPTSVNATYDAHALSSAITNPTKTDYIFGGWNTKDDGTGLTVIDASGNLVASQSGYTDASKNWIKDGGVTLYAKWTEHTYTNYRTVCCTEMGTINNSLSLTQGGNSVTISGWTYNDASSTKPAESNLASYTVRMYKKNGVSWDLVSGTATGGSAGTAGTRTGIATNSKSVTFTGLVVESEYKFTIEGIGAAGYCDIEETEITSINSTDVSSTPFKFRYSIYIDNGSGSGWEHNYITPTGNTDEGSVSITLGAHVDYYQFKIAGGFSGWWGQSGSSKIPANTKWTLNSDQNVRLETGAGGAYTFTVDYSGTTNPGVTVTFPSADQAADYKIYFDKSAVADWGATLKYRIGNGSHNQNQNFTLVPGTDQFYVTTTPDYDDMDAWQIANNVAWSGDNSIYNYYHADDATNITRATVFQDYAVDEDITIVPTSVHNTENSCQFWDVSKTSGMLTHTATITTPSHGTINIAYTDVSGTSQPTNTSTVADLAHRTILTITATPATGYTCTSLTVNGAAFTSGSTHILAADATIAATFTAQTSTVTLDNNNATSGSQQTVTATYDATMPLKTTADGTPAVAALTRTGYTFNGWWDNTSGGTQYYTYSGSPKVIASARTWNKTGAQTLKAQWIVNQYTLTWDLQGGTVATAGTGAAAAATGTPSSSQDYGTALMAPVVTKTGYNFNVWSPSVAATMPAENTTYTASWTAQVYNITYKDQGDNAYSGNATAGVPTGAPTTHTYGSATALVNGVKDGYRFDGWFTDASCTVSAGSSIGATAKTADFTLYAKWTQVYTVTWSVNGDTWSTGVVDGNTYVPSGSKVSALPTAPTSSDCDDSKVFVGWRATAIDGTSASNPGSIFTTQAGSPTISANTTFYAVFADVSGGNVLDLTFPDDNSENNGIKNYTSTWTAKEGTFEFSIANFNNNSWENSWAYIKCGRKDYASVASITTGSDIDFRVDSVLVVISSITSSKVNSAKLQISSTSDFGTKTEMDIPKSSGTQKLKIASPATDKYYRIVFDCQSNSNGFIQVNEVIFKQTLDTANYVTSCSSCDADATFTNTTPAVSDIDCTSATLTMEDGLATVGADGCHVSDYGFVIGTSDNPAIGGSGVTKLQVGTSDPTIGEDFSYDATGLTKGTRYYIRAYAINRHGTAYSTSTNFWTKNVSSIAITTAPTKTNYIVGETFDATGMVVTATMASGATEDVTSDVTYSTDALTAGTNKDFAINYTLCETDKSVNQKINVYTLSVSEGTNPTFGSYTVDGAVITVSLEAQKTFSFATTNCSTRDNGDGTYTVINVTGNATVVINYRNAVQVKVYYKVDGTTITSLTQDVYESSQTTLPTASALSSAMAAQGMALPDELYPNFIGWSETEFGAQTAAPTIVEGTPIINAEKNYYAVYSNVNKIRIDESDITSTSYPGSEQTLTKSLKDFKYYDICKNNTYYLQFKKTNNSYIYNNTAISNIAKIEVGASDTYDAVAVYAGSAANTISGSALEDENTSTSKYIYLFPSNTQYFIIKGNSSSTYRVNYIDIYYASSTVYYMTQFCTRYDITGATTSGTAVIVNGNTGGTLTSSHNELCEGKNLTLSATVNTQYSFGEWKIVKTGAEPEVDLTADLLGANKTSLTPPAFAMPGYGITVSATISEKTATAWSWTYNSAAIPDPMILYVGEVKQLDVTYTPDAAQLVAAQKNYSVDKESSVAQVSKTANYYRMRGAAGVTVETNTAVTFSLNSLSQVVNVTVKPLPSARFEDNVHNAVSTTVTATVTDGVVSLTKKTPTHADVAAPVGGNDCETTHLHLVGWIDGDWEPFINYMNGGSRPSDSDITSATGYFYLPNADIDLSTKDGKTYYAVWGKVDE